MYVHKKISFLGVKNNHKIEQQIKIFQAKRDICCNSIPQRYKRFYIFLMPFLHRMYKK